ncbi:hypothetical protein AGMMS49949_07330 [Alphaproteobacteria bacterium]|nr:hypothetical protein AGMMS49949_07330 [Alphaproteobacteria bacterium]GHS99818.1 hypothetical protein AGMMS50296_8070 [Alphaproteobacteria bacterium]
MLEAASAGLKQVSLEKDAEAIRLKAERALAQLILEGDWGAEKVMLGKTEADTFRTSISALPWLTQLKMSAKP